MSQGYTQCGTGVIPRTDDAGKLCVKALGLPIVGAVLAFACLYMVRQSAKQVPDDYADWQNDFPARVFLPSPRPSDRGGSPLSAAPVPSRLDEIEDDGNVTVFCDGHWEWGNSIKHNWSVTDD